MYKLLKYNINDTMYWAIKPSCNEHLQYCKVWNFYTDFIFSCGLWQGDTLSCTLFNLYTNYLVNELKKVQLGICFDDNHLRRLCR